MEMRILIIIIIIIIMVIIIMIAHLFSDTGVTITVEITRCKSLMLNSLRSKSFASWRQPLVSLGRGWTALAGWQIHWWQSAAER